MLQKYIIAIALFSFMALGCTKLEENLMAT
jgi:hypothetical protein